MNAQSYYANSINKQVEELDEYDLHVCRVANAFAAHKIEEVRGKAREKSYETSAWYGGDMEVINTPDLNNIFEEILNSLK